MSFPPSHHHQTLSSHSVPFLTCHPQNLCNKWEKLFLRASALIGRKNEVSIKYSMWNYRAAPMGMYLTADRQGARWP